jgi:hypothetical protein
MKAAAAFALAACPAAASAAPQRPAFDLVDFFTGRTHAESQIKVAFHKPLRHVTDSVGKRAANGDLILVDDIKEEGKPRKQRRWVMRKVGPSHFTGTLTDAVGPVDVVVNGGEARIRYRMKGGVSVDQTLTVRDSRTLANHVSAKKLGVRLGKLDGTIRKLD